jgi:hypothetical protein
LEASAHWAGEAAVLAVIHVIHVSAIVVASSSASTIIVATAHIVHSKVHLRRGAGAGAVEVSGGAGAGVTIFATRRCIFGKGSEGVGEGIGVCDCVFLSLACAEGVDLVFGRCCGGR